MNEFEMNKLDRLAEEHMLAKFEYDKAVQKYTNAHLDDAHIKTYKEVQRTLVVVEARLRLLKAHSEQLIERTVDAMQNETMHPELFNGEYDG